MTDGSLPFMRFGRHTLVFGSGESRNMDHSSRTPWLKKLDALITCWSLVVDQAEDLKDTKTKEHLANNSMVYGYRGVAEYFQLLHEHRASLEKVV